MSGSDDELAERARKLFAGPIAFLKSAPELKFLPDPTAPDAAPQAVPANLDFGQWLGVTPVKYYTEMRVHPQAYYSRPGWLRHEAHPHFADISPDSVNPR